MCSSQFDDLNNKPSYDDQEFKDQSEDSDIRELSLDKEIKEFIDKFKDNIEFETELDILISSFAEDKDIIKLQTKIILLIKKYYYLVHQIQLL